MERLTDRNKEIPLPCPDNAGFWASVHEKLARYEDLVYSPEMLKAIIGEWMELAIKRNEGSLIVLPCRVGDIVYINTPSGATLCEKVSSITKPEFSTRTLDGMRGLDFAFHEYGKTVFLTREEAERALQEARSGENKTAP